MWGKSIDLVDIVCCHGDNALWRKSIDLVDIPGHLLCQMHNNADNRRYRSAIEHLFEKVIRCGA